MAEYWTTLTFSYRIIFCLLHFKSRVLIVLFLAPAESYGCKSKFQAKKIYQST